MFIYFFLFSFKVIENAERFSRCECAVSKAPAAAVVIRPKKGPRAPGGASGVRNSKGARSAFGLKRKKKKMLRDAVVRSQKKNKRFRKQLFGSEYSVSNTAPLPSTVSRCIFNDAPREIESGSRLARNVFFFFLLPPRTIGSSRHPLDCPTRFVGRFATSGSSENDRIQFDSLKLNYEQK